MKYLLDTDHLSIFQRQSGAECTRLAQVASADVAFGRVPGLQIDDWTA